MLVEAAVAVVEVTKDVIVVLRDPARFYEYDRLFVRGRARDTPPELDRRVAGSWIVYTLTH